MLTRSQVARRLNKSIATVRRLEGWKLHPRRDVNGIHRFDPDEVRRVSLSARSPTTGRTSMPADSIARIVRRERESRIPEIGSATAQGPRNPRREDEEAIVESVQRLEEKLAALVALQVRREERESMVLAAELLSELLALPNAQLQQLDAEVVTELLE